MKISVIGAGNVGATAANVIALKGFASEVVLLDIKEGFAEGKAMDMMQTAKLFGMDTKITGVTGDYARTAGSSVIIITSGLARRPGMTREELVGTNAKIVKGVMDSCLQHSPEAVFIIVSNPADTLTYLALKDSGLPRERVETQAATVADLVAELSAREARYALAFADLAALRVALDQDLASFDAPLAGVREVAFFPPMTGG